MIHRHRYHKRRIPSRSRTLPIYGDPIKGNGLDAGKYYRCWNCGFVCNVDRDALGDAQSRSGVVVTDFVETPERAEQGILASLATLGDINHFHVAMKNGIDGSPKAIRHSQMVAEGGSGCPLCHSLNYRGDY